MKIIKLDIVNVKCFKSLSLIPSRSVNIFCGSNNSWKTTILQSLLTFQKTWIIDYSKITIWRDCFNIKTHYVSENEYEKQKFSDSWSIILSWWNPTRCTVSNSQHPQAVSLSHSQNFFHFVEEEPNNVFYPFLSKRKVMGYDNNVGDKATYKVTGTFQFLTAKVTNLSNASIPQHKDFIYACKSILWFEVWHKASSNWQETVEFITGFDAISLGDMWEWVSNILGLICDLCLAENKIFLIEELENDLHPKALKKLLSFIEEKSTNNQFFISTHSHIVLKQLWALKKSKVFWVYKNDEPETDFPRLKLSHVKEIIDKSQRRQLLEELGYEFFDYGLWEAWLILEESSAQVIMEYLIDWFVPNLKTRLKVYSAGGFNSIKKKLKGMLDLFVYLHLSQVYENKAWVCIDDWEEEKAAIDKMKHYYVINGDWDDSRFHQLSQHDFEKYYPERFSDAITSAIRESDDQKKRVLKKALIEEVRGFIESDPENAKKEFGQSAWEVIEFLEWIDAELNT